MKNIKITIEYDGKNYFGWQKQPDVPTVQGTLEDVLSSFLSEQITLTGCSRTDAGVSAVGYVANFYSDTQVPPDKFAAAVRHALPDDILIISSEDVPDDFHATYSARSKTYRYYFSSSKILHPLFSERIWQINAPLSFENMKEAAGYFTGTHEFDAFKNADPSSDKKNTRKTVYNAKVFRPLSEDDDLYCFEVTGDGFLYNMVRIMAGTLANVGEGKIDPSEIKNIIDSKDRKKAGVTAPACGLYLYHVDY